MERFDVCVVGAGVVGLAIAYRLSLSNYRVILLEKNTLYGQETSSRNSEVIHAGIYYPPGSLKARFCVEGKNQLYTFCETYNVPFRKTGKLIVAQSESQRGELIRISENAVNNGVHDLQFWEANQLAEAEPKVKGVAALFSPSTGIIDSYHFMTTLLTLAQQGNVLYAPSTEFINAKKTSEHFDIQVKSVGEPYEFQADNLIDAAGLSAMRVANNIDTLSKTTIPKLHLCKGDYFSYSGVSPFSHLVYPLPEPNSTGLGIHATLDLGGSIRFGPDAYYLVDENQNDETQDLGIHYSLDETKRTRFAEAIGQYFPDIDTSRLQPAYSGVRPKLSPQGAAAQDFQIQTSREHQLPGLICLYGIESPGLTSSLAIADYIETLI